MLQNWVSQAGAYHKESIISYLPNFFPWPCIRKQMHYYNIILSCSQQNDYKEDRIQIFHNPKNIVVTREISEDSITNPISTASKRENDFFMEKKTTYAYIEIKNTKGKGLRLLPHLKSMEATTKATHVHYTRSINSSSPLHCSICLGSSNPSS